jgi:tetratricopeptide (TPR) repeat protein
MLDEAAERVDGELSDQPEVRAEMLGNIGADYVALGKFDSARRFLRKANDLDLKVFGPDDMRTGSVLYALANLSYLNGDYANAETRIRQALLVFRKHANDPTFELPSLTAILSDCAFILRARGHLDEAESLWKEVLTYGPRQPPKYRSAQTMVKTYLAQLYVDRGDIERADQMATAAVNEAQALGNPFAMTQTLIDLGNVRRFERRYGEAESLIEEGTKLFAQAQGDDHPNVVFGLTQLAYAYYYEGRYSRAEQEARKAFAMAAKLAKSSHFYSGAEVALGRVLNRTGRSLEAETLLREALTAREGIVPRRSTAMAFTLLGSLGECLMTEKRYAEAEPLLKESYETLTALQVSQSPMLEEARQRLVSLYDDWGKPQAADRYRRESGR